MGIRENLAVVAGRIEAACVASGRDASEVRLLPVSKTKPAAAVLEAFQAGCRRFGENKVQEAQAKHDALADVAGLEWAIIGHLQTNKARYVADFAVEFQALDSIKVPAGSVRLPENVRARRPWPVCPHCAAGHGRPD